MDTNNATSLFSQKIDEEDEVCVCVFIGRGPTASHHPPGCRSFVEFCINIIICVLGSSSLPILFIYIEIYIEY